MSHHEQGPASDDWRERLLGGRDRLGWWMLPLFLMVGLGGAVLAGSMAVVYYSAQVSALEQETSGAREDLAVAADDVREAADEALEAIDEEVASVRAEIARGLPLEDALEVGVVRLEVAAELEAPPDGDASDESAGQQPDAPAPTQQQGPQVIQVRRAASGFVVVASGDDVFVVTTLGLLADPRTDDRVPVDVEVTVRLPAGSTTATVHSWDEDHELLLLRSAIGNIEPLPWAAQDTEVEPGDRLVAIGSTADLEPVRVGAELAGASSRVMVTSLPALTLIDGGPVVDLEGDVVGISLASHHALGGDPLVVPVRRLCDRLLETCPG